MIYNFSSCFRKNQKCCYRLLLQFILEENQQVSQRDEAVHSDQVVNEGCI